MIGYCYGGLLAWLSATRLHPDAAVGYYAGRIGNFAEEHPSRPRPASLRQARHSHPRRAGRQGPIAHPEVEINWYENAGHGFNCDMRASYNAEASALARDRALAFLKKHLV